MVTNLDDSIQPSEKVASPNHKALRQRLNESGIGFAGVDGVWWRPASETFHLPKDIAQQLEEIGPALLTFINAVIDLYWKGSSKRLNESLRYKLPNHIPRLVTAGRVESLRPDFQLCPTAKSNSSYQLMATELEICPSAHGFAHAMQAAYGLATDLAEGFARYLDGRPFLFAGTQAWSEFLFEQLVFCRALEEAGAEGRVLYDLPLAKLADEVRQGKRWQPPLFGIPFKPQDWDDDVVGRIRKHDLTRFMWLDDEEWPEDIGKAVVFRFGYFDCFSSEKLRYFQNWQQKGAKLLNPTIFFLENKALMAAINLPEVREHLDEQTLKVLEQCIPQTILINERNFQQVLDEKDDWVVKYAAYDGGNQAWGSRSLEIGRRHSRKSWRKVLADYLALPWPSVAQRTVPTARVDQIYLDSENQIQSLPGGQTRLRVFLLRDESPSSSALPGAVACGAHITVSEGTTGVAEGINAVQAPVNFV